jgi:hypothetical protein
VVFSRDDVVFSRDDVVFSGDDVVFSRDDVVFSRDDVVIDRDDVVMTGTKRSRLGRSGFSAGRSLTFYDDVGFPRDDPGYLGTMKAFPGTIPAPWDVAAIMWDVPV